MMFIRIRKFLSRPVRSMLSIAILFFFFTGCADLSTPALTESPLPPASHDAGMELCFVKTVDDADCCILMSQGHTVLIDTGEAQDYSHMKEILNGYDIQNIDCMILTHPDKDHIGSAYQIAKDFTVGLVLEPIYEKKDDRYDLLNSFLDSEDIPRQCLSAVYTLSVGEMQITVYPPNEREYSKDNNYSLATLVAHDQVTLFFPGDAMKKRTREIMELPIENVDLYKMSYHGRWYKGADELLSKMNADYIVVPSDHVEPELVQLIAGKRVFYTRSQDWYFASNGIELVLNNESAE